MSIQKRLATLAFVALATVCASAADLTGSWNTEIETPMGKVKYTYVLKQSGEKVTGKAISDLGGEKRETELKDVKLQGSVLTFIENMDFQGNTIVVEYKGTVAGDEIKFARKVGEYANEEFVAKKLKDEAAPAPAPKK